ncbi:hypothetical protein EVAR_102174_1 [Eumeta japonica]|uniref:Uncharacterized protein n=1 Tax=Eumeta variegata TaxID=151549 RepID=A0A4C1ZER7_EUMVA|nr:hypothetical protein EVAR_102174_1 [Eumeta japonica]
MKEIILSTRTKQLAKASNINRADRILQGRRPFETLSVGCNLEAGLGIEVLQPRGGNNTPDVVDPCLIKFFSAPSHMAPRATAPLALPLGRRFGVGRPAAAPRAGGAAVPRDQSARPLLFENSRDKLAHDPSESSWTPQPIDTRNPKGTPKPAHFGAAAELPTAWLWYGERDGMESLMSMLKFRECAVLKPVHVRQISPNGSGV